MTDNDSDYEVIDNSPFKKLARLLFRQKEASCKLTEDLRDIVKPVDIEAIEKFKATGVIHRIDLVKDIALLGRIISGLETSESVVRVKNLIEALNAVKSHDIYDVLRQAEKQNEKNEKAFLFFVKRENVSILRETFAKIDISDETWRLAYTDAVNKNSVPLINWLNSRIPILTNKDKKKNWYNVLGLSALVLAVYSLIQRFPK